MGLPTELARVSGRTLSPVRLRPLLRGALFGKQLALCLHRVHPGARRTGERLPKMSMRRSQVDELIDRLLDARPASLTVSFDDGYADAAEYIASRARRLPEVRFLFFVCPRKIEEREPFAWDVEERSSASADEADFQLAAVDECRALMRLANVRLGNHTNSHQRLTELTSEELRAELTRSTEDFNALFGATLDFAIPYGTPRTAFGERELTALRAHGYERIWTTDPRPITARDEAAGVLPRYALDGTWSSGELLAWVAVRSMTSRLPGRSAA